MTIKKSHKILLGVAFSVGLLGLGGAAIAAPMSGDAAPTASPSAKATSTTSPEELKKLYSPIITAQEALVKQIQASADQATGKEKDRLTRMKDAAERHLQRLKDMESGKIGQGQGKQGKGKDGKGRHGHRHGDKPGGSATPSATPTK